VEESDLVHGCRLTELSIGQRQEAEAEEAEAAARGAVGCEEEQVQVLERAVFWWDCNLITTSKCRSFSAKP
jgi:hypothetical protein